MTEQSPELEPHQFTVATRTLVAVLLTTFAWQLEGFVILLHILKKRPLPIAPHLVLLTLAVVINIACVRWAKAEERNAPSDLRGLVLKPGQPLVVVVLIVGFGAIVGLTQMFLVRP